MQVALLDSLPAGRAADILEEMAPDEAADVLQELAPERSAQVLANMDSEEAEEVRELLGFEENTAGGLMTTEFLMVKDSVTVEGVIAAMAGFEGPLDSIYAVYLVDDRGVLTGAVPVARLLLAERRSPIRDVAIDSPIAIPYFEHEKIVVAMFRKYNLLTLPVVDDSGRLLGVVTADDVFELVVKET
jgi:Mg/Co/Ni transporter MgtE